MGESTSPPKKDIKNYLKNRKIKWFLMGISWKSYGIYRDLLGFNGKPLEKLRVFQRFEPNTQFLFTSHEIPHSHDISSKSLYIPVNHHMISMRSPLKTTKSHQRLKSKKTARKGQGPSPASADRDGCGGPPPWTFFQGFEWFRSEDWYTNLVCVLEHDLIFPYTNLVI